MENEETDNVEVLQTEDGTFVDNVVDSLEIPEITEEEANDREYEEVEIEQESGM